VPHERRERSECARGAGVPPSLMRRVPHQRRQSGREQGAEARSPAAPARSPAASPARSAAGIHAARARLTLRRRARHACRRGGRRAAGAGDAGQPPQMAPPLARGACSSGFSRSSLGPVDFHRSYRRLSGSSLRMNLQGHLLRSNTAAVASRVMGIYNPYFYFCKQGFFLLQFFLLKLLIHFTELKHAV
jgi:hypothetical protein